MAFLRKDTPLANTTDPGKGNINKATILGPKIDPTKMKMAETKTFSRDSINNGRVVGRINETITTFKGNSNTPSKPSAAVKTSASNVRTGVNTPKKTVTPAKSTEETKVVKTKSFTPAEESIKTKSVGVMPMKGAEIKKADASALTQRGDNRTWQEKRKQEARKKEYNQYKQGDETMSEWKERSKKASEEVSRKAKPTGAGFLRAKTSNSSGGGGGCHSC